VSIFNKTIDKLFPAEESTGTESEIERLRARLATVEAALLGVREHTLSDGPCWCVLAKGPDDEHTTYCLAARYALAGDAPRGDK
jgi:hypothetical protein